MRPQSVELQQLIAPMLFGRWRVWFYDERGERFHRIVECQFDEARARAESDDRAAGGRTITFLRITSTAEGKPNASR